jgi:integrase
VLKTAASVAAVATPSTGRVQVPDALVPGLALRVTATGARSWILRYQPPGAPAGAAARLHVVTLADLPAPLRAKRPADAGPLLTLAEARSAAEALRSRLAAGETLRAAPAPVVPTVANLAPRWLAFVQGKRSTSTHSNYHTAMHTHVLPVLGSHRVIDVERRDVAALHEAMRATPIAANRTLAALGVFFTWCEREGHRPLRSSPVYGIEKYPETRRRRFLSGEELARLGAVLTRAEREGLPPSPAMKKKAGGMADARKATHGTRPARGPYRRTAAPAPPRKADPFAVAALRLALLTGWRLAEVMSLRWDAVDLERRVAHHATTKAGAMDRPLSAPAVALLADLPRVAGSPCCFPSPTDAAVPLGKPARLWDAVRHAAGLDSDDKARRVMPHDLRHSVGAMLASSGASLPVIASLLGHRQVATTERYAHLHRDARHEAIDRAAGDIAAALTRGADAADAPDAAVIPLAPRGTDARRSRGA